MTPTLALIGKDPAAGSAKTRIAATLGRAVARSIAEALVLDSADALLATAPAGARLVFYHDPPDAGPSLRALGIPLRFDLVPQPAGTLGDRLAHLSERELSAGASACVIAAIDSPFVLDPAISACLPATPGEIVLGPCEDGGYWAVGLDAPAPAIFAVEMSTDDVLAETVARGEALGRPVRLLPPMPDIDHAEDLERAAARGLLTRAPRTALAWERACTLVPTTIRRTPPARLLGLLVVAAALLVGLWARRADVFLGAKTAPLFWVEYHDTFPPRWWWPIGPLLVALVAAALLLKGGDRVGQRFFPLAAFLIALVARAGLATVHYGTAEWWWPFDRPGGRSAEYPSAFGVVHGHPLAFLDHFAELVPHLPIHPSGHPAGATLLALILYRAGGGVAGYGVIVMVAAAATAWPAYWAGRRLVGDPAARLAVLVWAFAPVTLIYGATSFDGLFALLALFVVAAFATDRVRLGAVGSALLFGLSYALALVPLYAALAARPRRRGVLIALASGAAGLLFVIALYLVAGYDTLGAIRATQDAYQRGIGGRRPLWYWCFGGMAAFLICLGPVLAERFLRGIERGTPGARALVLCALLAAASGVMEAEVERIWQFAVPLAAIAAGPLLTRRRVGFAMVLGTLMAYAIELRWDTTF